MSPARHSSYFVLADLVDLTLQLSNDGSAGGGHNFPSPPPQPSPLPRDDFPDDRAATPASRSHSRRSSSVSSSRPEITSPVNGSPHQSVSSPPIPLNNTNGRTPHHQGGPPRDAITYPQQYPSGVQGVPIVGGTYIPTQGFLYPNTGYYQTYVQVLPGVVQSHPVALGPSIIIRQPAQQPPRQTALCIWMTHY